MKIGINASFARKFNTGIGQVTVNYLKALSKDTQNFDYVLYLEEELELNFSKFKKQVFLPLWKRDDLIRKILWEKYLLPGKIKRDKCKSFISLYQCPTILPKKIKHTMVVHDIIPKLFPEYVNNFRKKMYWKMTEKAIKKADKIIAISEHTKKDLMDYLHIAEDKISVRHIDVDNIYKREILDDESQHVLEKYKLAPGYIYNTGGLDKRKNIEKLLKAYKILIEKVEKAPDLVISGKLKPEMKPLMTDGEGIAKDLGIKDRVVFLDFVPQDDMPALYKNAKIFVYPSIYEGFGLPVLEAMNVGVPVLTSGISSIPEVGGEAVRYIDPESPRNIAENMEEVLNSEEIQTELKSKEKKQANKFSWESFVK